MPGTIRKALEPVVPALFVFHLSAGVGHDDRPRRVRKRAFTGGEVVFNQKPYRYRQK